LYGLGWIGYVGTAAVQTPTTIVGLKVICVLLPAIFTLGSWAAFKFVWNITPEIREKLAKKKAETIAVIEGKE
jgi:Na+/melibiose symporter-like transporter